MTLGKNRRSLQRWHCVVATSDGREVDFVVVEGRKPILFVEAKLGDTPIDKGLRYLKARFQDCDAWQLSAAGSKDYLSPEGIRVAPALTLLRTLV